MRKTSSLTGGHARPFGDRQWLLPFLASLLVSAALLLAAVFTLLSPPQPPDADDSVVLDLISVSDADPGAAPDVFGPLNSSTASVAGEDSAPPRIAYLITGTKGDSIRMRRTLAAVYHPRNQYVLHLDMEAPPRERIELAMYVKGQPTYAEVENVRVIGKGNLVTYKGVTMVACTLHAVAVLLKEGVNWDWFINLSASDYPLMTQDDILHVFSSLPRDLNFIEHQRISGWKMIQRGRPIVIDPGLYLSKKFDLTMTSDRRELPTSFDVYTGSAWVALTRPFLEYCIWGWDNLPRTVLMYYANFISSPEGYFHTVICNAGEEFRGTAVGHDLHYIAWDNPPKQHPLTLTSKDFDRMVKSGAPFARKFPKDAAVLDRIDAQLLGRAEGQFTPGAWCVGSDEDGGDRCQVRGDDDVFRPGPGAERLRGLMRKVLSAEYRNGSCSTMSYDQTKREWIKHP